MSDGDIGNYLVVYVENRRLDFLKFDNREATQRAIKNLMNERNMPKEYILLIDDGVAVDFELIHKTVDRVIIND